MRELTQNVQNIHTNPEARPSALGMRRRFAAIAVPLAAATAVVAAVVGGTGGTETPRP
ncbi:hypothetical protein [Streptomyces zaomyceticus]|uniref:hypothetical protein n=1 Tax=Streptomyces zaomyceticus TaxID=68286 RepID=UPI0036A983DA